MAVFKRLFKKELFEKELLSPNAKIISEGARKDILEEAEEHPKTIMTFQPHGFGEVQVIADHLMHKRSAIVDVQRLDKKETLKLINFLLGVIYTIDGSVKKLSDSFFVFVPKNINVSHKTQKVLKEE